MNDEYDLRYTFLLARRRALCFMINRGVGDAIFHWIGPGTFARCHSRKLSVFNAGRNFRFDSKKPRNPSVILSNVCFSYFSQRKCLLADSGRIQFHMYHGIREYDISLVLRGGRERERDTYTPTRYPIFHRTNERTNRGFIVVAKNSWLEKRKVETRKKIVIGCVRSGCGKVLLYHRTTAYIIVLIPFVSSLFVFFHKRLTALTFRMEDLSRTVFSSKLNELRSRIQRVSKYLALS